MDVFRFILQDPSAEKSITLNLDEYVHEESDGFGLPPLLRFEERSPALQGALDRGFRLLPRRLTFRLALRAGSPAELVERRATLIDVLRPQTTGTASTLFVILPDESVWMLTVHCTELTFTGGPGLTQTARFRLTASSPAFSQYISPASLVFGQAEINTTKVLAYSGTWNSVPYPISIRGPITHPVIRNLSAGTKLDIDATLTESQIVSIDLREGHKTILSGGVSLIEHLSSDSDLEGFCLLPSPEAPQGDNVIQVTGANTGSGTRVSLSYVPVRLGL